MHRAARTHPQRGIVANDPQSLFAVCSCHRFTYHLSHLHTKMVTNFPFRIICSHLSDPSNREAFESAHSVVLGIFTTHAQTVRECKVNANWIHGPEDGGSSKRRSFFEILVPFYAGCLIDVSCVYSFLFLPDLLCRCFGNVELSIRAAQYTSAQTCILRFST